MLLTKVATLLYIYFIISIVDRILHFVVYFKLVTMMYL